MAKHWLIYADDVYGHFLAAIAERYLKQKKTNVEIEYWPNKTKHLGTHLVFPKGISGKDTIWILGQSPTQRGMIDVKSEIRPAKVYWYDYHISLIERIFEDKESYGIDKYPGLRSSKPILAQQMWSDLFPKEKIPPCVTWMDEFMQGQCSNTARAFVYGLSLIDTDPKVLNSYPAAPDGFNDPSNVWEECFKVKNPINLDDPQREYEEDTTTRMTWDATFQLINMGSIISTFIKLKTQDACDKEEFREHELSDGTKLLLINETDLDEGVLYDYYTSTGSTYPYVGWYSITVDSMPSFWVSIVKLPEGKSAIELAKKFRNAHGDNNVARFQTDVILYNKVPVSKGPKLSNEE